VDLWFLGSPSPANRVHFPQLDILVCTASFKCVSCSGATTQTRRTAVAMGKGAGASFAGVGTYLPFVCLFPVGHVSSELQAVSGTPPPVIQPGRFQS
jgi:hypothetical protein